MTQPSTPFAERAAHRCECPRRSSTRQSSSVVPSREPRRARVEDGVRRIGPVRRGQDRVLGVAVEEDLVAAARRHVRYSRAARGDALPARSAERISSSASRKDSVDSAPWFSFTRSAWSPSRQPPVAGVVERLLQLVLSEEPVERAPRVLAPSARRRSTRCASRHAETIAHASTGCWSKRGLGAAARVEAVRADRARSSRRPSAGSTPSHSSERRPDRDHLLVLHPRAGHDERLRQARVAVREAVLEPGPVGACSCAR